MTATHKDRPLRYQGVTWIRYREGKMVEGWDCWDVSGMMQLLSDPLAGSGLIV
jgi:hypothetical protein